MKEVPAIDLHRHLEGSIRPQTIVDLARKHNLPLPKTLDTMLPLVQVSEPTPGIMPFIERLDRAITSLVNLDACHRIVKEAIEDAAKDHIIYLELRFSPLYMARPHNLHPKAVVEAVIDGVKEGERAYHVRTNVIGIISRTFGLKECEREFEALLSARDHIVALDVAGDEIHFPPELFIDIFKRARDAGWRSCPHAGEVSGPESIWRAIIDLHADRLGHAVHAIEDPKLLDYIAAHRIGIESNLTSNVQTTTVQSYRHHPLKTFLHHGILATINTDDPSVSGITLTHELEVAAPCAGLTPGEIARAQKNAWDIAFLSEKEKRALKEKF